MRPFFRCLVLSAAIPVLLGAAAPPSFQASSSTEALLDRITARLDELNPKSSWTAAILSTQIEHDRHWMPKRTTVQTKTVTVTGGRREEKILKVVQTEDGKTEDITDHFIIERREKWRKYQARQGTSGEGELAAAGRSSRRRIRTDDYAALLPFSPERRPEFSFSVREGTAPDGRPVFLVDVRAVLKDVLNWEGTYTIDAETFTPLSARLRPSENPTFVKDLEVQADFRVFEGVNFIPLRTWARINAGFLFFKRIRAVSEEVYSDIQVTHEPKP